MLLELLIAAVSGGIAGSAITYYTLAREPEPQTEAPSTLPTDYAGLV